MAASVSAQLLDQELHSVRFGRAARVVQEVSSTVDLAWEWLKQGAPQGAVVIAEQQRRGRGRLGRSWLSPAGGLWMSVITAPMLRASAAGRLGAGMAMAAAEGVMRATGISVGLKWPNDLVVGGKKLGGVLVETQARRERIEAAVLSLGLNVNIPIDAFPGELRDTATSLLELSGREYPVEAIAARILESLEEMWSSVLFSGTELVERWNGLDVLSGHEVEVLMGDTALRGVSMGMGMGGELILMAEGETRRVAVGEVRSVRSVTA